MISILSPTRHRPHLITRLIDSILDTVSDPYQVELCLYIDEDDDSYSELLQSGEFDTKIRTVWKQGPKIVISDMWNECAKMASGDILHHASDDFVYRSKDWDLKVRSHFDKYDDKILLVYGRDGHQDANLGTLSFVHKNWIDALGYVVPPYFMVDWCDTWINDISAAIGRRIYDPDIYTEHMHWAAGKSEIDITYAERDTVRQENSGHSFYQELEPKRQEDIIKLQNYITTFRTLI